MTLAYSNGKPGVLNRSYPISVRFADPVEIEFPIKIGKGGLDLIHQLPILNLPELTGRTESQAFPWPNQCLEKPLHDKVLKPGNIGVATISNPDVVNGADGKYHLIAPARKTRNRPKNSRSSLRPARFQLHAPQARSVKLAADFTGWGESPLEMIKEQKGIWGILVSLLPGEYAYRFIVDGEWYEDPLSPRSHRNPYGTVDSVKHVG